MVTVRPTVADQLALEHEMVDKPEPSGGDLRQNLVDLVTGKVGQESEMPEIDPDHRHLSVAHPSGRAEHRAVSPEDDHEIDRRGRVGGGEGMKATLPPIPLRGRPIYDRVAVAAERRPDAGGDFGDPGEPRRGDDGDPEVVDRCR